MAQQHKVKSIIFDCDGVLIDSEIIANRIEVEMKKQHGIAITLEEQLQKFVGLGFNDPVMQEELKRLPHDYRIRFHALTRQTYQTELKAIDGVLETLKKLFIPKCVASNSDTESLLHKLALTKLSPYFPKNAAFSGQMVTHGKPSPDLFLLALEKMNWDPKHCLVIEDSVAGVTGAKAAGLRVCGFLGGGHMYPGHAEKLQKAGVDEIITHFRDVLQFI